jgi:hypothetical protein
MLTRKWGGKLLFGVILSCAARMAAAQESQAPGDEIRDLKRRLEILEKEKAEREAKNNAPPSVLLMDPAEEKWYDRVKLGGGVRASFRSVTHSAPDGKDASADFALESGRLYTGGKITEYLSATLNAEFTSGSAAVLDAIAQFKVAEEFNIFVGRMLPATDRSNSDGPYYLATWDFPFLSDGFNATGKLGDRDDGITFWGDVGKFKYWVGAYEGNEHAGANVHDNLLYAARVQYDFMDPENGYYLTSTYYGDKKILAVGLVANYQGRAAGTVGNPVGFGNVALDVLWEQKLDFLADGVATVEAAYYYFGRHGFTAGNPPGPFDVGAGNGVLFLVAYLIPGKVGWGQFQPHIRYQGFDEIDAGTARNPTPSNQARWDFGVNYVMAGHNARVSMVYSHTDFSGPTKSGMLTIGTQFQF